MSSDLTRKGHPPVRAVGSTCDIGPAEEEEEDDA